MGTIRQVLWWGQLAGCYGFALFSPCSIAGAQIGLVAALVFWVLDFGFEVPRPFPARALVLPVLFYAASVSAAALFGISTKNSLSSLVELWLFLPLFFFSRRLADPVLRRRLFDVLVFSSGTIALYAILQHFTGWHPHRPEPLMPLGNRFRSLGSFSMELTFGLYFTFVAAVCFCLVWEKRGQTRRKWYLLVSALSFLAVLFSGGRAPLVSISVGILLILLLLKAKDRWLVVPWAAALTVAAYLASPAVFSRVKLVKTFDFQQSNPDSRAAIWKRSYEIFQERPVLGVGPGNFKTAYAPKIKGLQTGLYGHAHNDCLNILVTTGLVGLAAFLFFWKELAGRIWKGVAVMEEGPDRNLLAAGLTSVGIYAAYSLFESSFTDQEPLMLLFFLLAAALSTLEKRNPKWAPFL
jgi:putative inorganic carbon (HCO3(-)) transporter